MITVVNKKGIFKSYSYFHSKTLSFRDIFRLSFYGNFLGVTHKKSFFFCKNYYHSLHINLLLDENELYKGLKSNTRNEINRAVNASCVFVENVSTEEFVEFYNLFAAKKGLKPINTMSLAKYGENLKITGVSMSGEILTLHAYYTDIESGFTTLLYSASKRLDNVDESLLKLIGYSNRFLHYQDLLYFKKEGFLVYDFGGIYLGQDDRSQIGIAQFKKSFGGEVVKIINYLSYPYLYSLRLLSFLKK